MASNVASMPHADARARSVPYRWRRNSPRATRVAQEGYDGFMAGHRVVVPGTPNRIMTLLPRLLPRRLTLAMMQRRWQRKRRT